MISSTSTPILPDFQLLQRACACIRIVSHVIKNPREGAKKELLHKLAAKMMAYQKRLKKEYEELSMRAPTGIFLDQETMEDNIDM